MASLAHRIEQSIHLKSVACLCVPSVALVGSNSSHLTVFTNFLTLCHFRWPCSAFARLLVGLSPPFSLAEFPVMALGWKYNYNHHGFFKICIISIYF